MNEDSKKKKGRTANDMEITSTFKESLYTFTLSSCFVVLFVYLALCVLFLKENYTQFKNFLHQGFICNSHL